MALQISILSLLGITLKGFLQILSQPMVTNMVSLTGEQKLLCYANGNENQGDRFDFSKNQNCPLDWGVGKGIENACKEIHYFCSRNPKSKKKRPKRSTIAILTGNFVKSCSISFKMIIFVKCYEQRVIRRACLW